MQNALLLAEPERLVGGFLERHLTNDGFDVVRRAGPRSPGVIEAGRILVDQATRVVTVAGRFVMLTGREFELLVKLASDPTRVFTKEELLRDVWGFRSVGRTRTLDSHASRLRRKLARAGGGPFVVNVWGVGYRLLED